MLGLKKSIIPVKQALKAAHVKSYTETSFHQGYTTRWGIAWTYHEDFDLRKFQDFSRNLKKSDIKTYSHIFEDQEISKVLESLEVILNDLKIDYKKISSNDEMVEFTCKAYEKTWFHTRRKRRLLQRIDNLKSDLLKLKLLLNDFNDKAVQNLPFEGVAECESLIEKLTETLNKGSENMIVPYKTEFLTLQQTFTKLKITTESGHESKGIKRSSNDRENGTSSKKIKVLSSEEETSNLVDNIFEQNDEITKTPAENGHEKNKKNIDADSGSIKNDSLEKSNGVNEKTHSAVKSDSNSCHQECILEFSIFCKKCDKVVKIDFTKYLETYQAVTLNDLFQYVIKSLNKDYMK